LFAFGLVGCSASNEPETEESDANSEEDIMRNKIDGYDS
jgi:hypothetical protein